MNDQLSDFLFDPLLLNNEPLDEKEFEDYYNSICEEDEDEKIED